MNESPRTEPFDADAWAETLSATDVAELVKLLNEEGGNQRLLGEVWPEEAPKGLTLEEAKCRRAYSLLKLLMSSAHRARWTAIGEKRKLYREEAVLDLWALLATRCEDFVVKEHSSLAYHRHYIFEWLLGRYEVGRARSVFSDSPLARGGHWFLILGVVMAAAIRLLWPTAFAWGRIETAAILLGLAYLVVVGGLAACLRRKAAGWWHGCLVAAQSLAPRLMGAAAVGVVVLASSEELLRFVTTPETEVTAAGIGLMAAAVFYLFLHMSRRIHPLPPLGRIARLTLDMAALTFSHGLALALVAEAAFRRIVCDLPPYDVWSLLQVTAFVSVLGLVLNLIWAETPLTEPF